MRYAVTSVELVGNEESGWEINDQHQIGTIDVADAVIDDDQLILDVLAESGYLDNPTIDDFAVVGDRDFFTINEWESDRPVLALVLQQ